MKGLVLRTVLWKCCADFILNLQIAPSTGNTNTNVISCVVCQLCATACVMCDMTQDCVLDTSHITHKNNVLFYLFTAVWYYTHTHMHTHFNKRRRMKSIYVSKLPTWLWTVSLAIEVVTSASYKIYLTFLQAIKSYPFFWNNSVVIGPSRWWWWSDA